MQPTISTESSNFASSLPAPTNKNSKFILFIIIGIILLSGAFFAGVKLSPKVQYVKQNSVNIPPSPTPELSNETCQVYASYTEGQNAINLFMDLSDEKIKTVIPSGYSLSYSLDDFSPNFFILSKGDSLYSYNIKNQILNEVIVYPDLKIKKDEVAKIYPSVTEKEKFFIIINKYGEQNANEINGMGLPPEPIGSRSYTFNASTNELRYITGPEFKYLQECKLYDSKNLRFFVWACGEGIGNALPLETSDLTGKERKTIVTAEDFASREPKLINVSYNGGLFFILAKDKPGKIMTINPLSPDPVKEEYIVSDQVKSKFEETYPYSVGLDRQSKSIVIGSSDFLLFLRFDENRRIFESAYFPEKEVFANFIFLFRGKLYYGNMPSRGLKVIRVVNLSTWLVEKTIPSQASAGVNFICL